MSRIPLVSGDTLTAEQKPVVDKILGLKSRGKAIPAPYQLSLHNPELTDKWQQIGGLLRYGTSLPTRLKELAILVTARHWSCQYEWYAHASVAREAGIDKSIVEAIRFGKRPTFVAKDEEVVYQYCTELLQKHFVAASTHQAARDSFGVVGTVELTALVGYYVMVAMALNAHDYPLPPDFTETLPTL